MAEFDDFFAKKDKKKKGKKAKKFVGTNPTNISKALEVTAPTPSLENEKPKKEALIDLPSSNAADDEWREVEVNEENLEGLKVRSLRPDGSSDPVDSGEKKEEDNETHEEAEVNTESSGGGSAWQPVAAKNTTEQETTDEVVEEEEEPEQEEKEKTPPPSPPAPAKSAAYVPPARRNQPPPGAPSRDGGPMRGPGMGRRGKVAPPDILSDEAFPTLGGN